MLTSSRIISMHMNLVNLLFVEKVKFFLLRKSVSQKKVLKVLCLVKIVKTLPLMITKLYAFGSRYLNLAARKLDRTT